MERHAASHTGYTTPSPVIVSPELLPLHDHNLPWERFEAFSRDFVLRLPGVKDCKHYGKAGNAQDGIDLTVEMADGTTGTIQCRQRASISGSDAEQIIKETKYSADFHVIMASCEVGVDARNSVKELPEWDVWDVRDVSQKVRELPLDIAARLVEGHFGPEWRAAFTGLREESPFVGPDDYFASLMDRHRLFNHSWTLVGRDSILDDLRRFAESGARVAVLKGRGGIGKTRVLQAANEGLAEKFNAVRFLLDDLPVTPENIRYLPNEERTLLVVDDAHRRDDLGTLLAAARRRDSVKVIVSTRSQGYERLSTQLTLAGYDTSELVELPEVKELSREEVTALAAEALGAEMAEYADRLAALTWDCPLVTVVGGQLLATRGIDLSLLERDDDFRRAVLNRFTDVLLGSVSDHVDPKTCRALLEAVAATSPVRLDKPDEIDGIASFLGENRSDVMRTLGELETAGVLLRRGYTVRITPDVLADHILHLACLTDTGDATGYADEIFERFSSICPADVLRNLGELDWRQQSSTGEPSDVLNGVWQSIKEAFISGGHMARARILEVLKPAAYYLPIRVLDLVEISIRQPVEERPEPGGEIYKHTHRDVLDAIPELIRAIAFTMDCLPKCCDLLWEIGRDNTERTNDSGHPMRILKDLSSYKPMKPVSYHGVIVEAAKGWLKESDSHDHAHSPLDVLDPMLSKVGEWTESRGHQIIMHSFHIDEPNTRELRRDVLDVVGACLSDSREMVRVRAVRSLQEGLRAPMPIFGLEITDDTRRIWIPEMLRILSMMTERATNEESSIVLMSIDEATSWYSRNAADEEIQSAVMEIRQLVDESFELRLTRFLTYNYDRGWQPDRDEEAEEVGAQYAKRMEELGKQQEEVADELLSRHPDADAVLSDLEIRLESITSVGKNPEPGLFLHKLAGLSLDFSIRACEWILETLPQRLKPYFGTFVRRVRAGDLGRSLALARAAVDSGDAVLCWSVAQSYWWDGWFEDHRPEDFALIRELLGHDDWGVRRMAISVLGPLGRSASREAIDLALEADLGESGGLADELCQALCGGWGVSPDDLTEDEAVIVLTKLVSVDGIEGHWVREFLKRRIAIDPRGVVALIMRRLESADAGGSQYHPIPYDGLDLSGIETAAEYGEVMREVRDRMLTGSPIEIDFWIPDLFKSVSMNFSDESLDVLGEWVDSGDEKKVRSAARLLKNAPSDLLFVRVDFVGNLLERAHAINEDCYRRVGGHLHSAAFGGTHWGTPGQPRPHDVEIRDRASEVAAAFVPGSPRRLFYDSLVESAERSIKDDLARDEELE